MGKKGFGGITVAGVEVKEDKHRGAQTVMALVLGVLFCGPVIAWALGWKGRMSVAEIGVAVAAGVLVILAIAVWAIRTWDY